MPARGDEAPDGGRGWCEVRGLAGWACCSDDPVKWRLLRFGSRLLLSEVASGWIEFNAHILRACRSLVEAHCHFQGASHSHLLARAAAGGRCFRASGAAGMRDYHYGSRGLRATSPTRESRRRIRYPTLHQQP